MESVSGYRLMSTASGLQSEMDEDEREDDFTDENVNKNC